MKINFRSGQSQLHRTTTAQKVVLVLTLIATVATPFFRDTVINTIVPNHEEAPRWEGGNLTYLSSAQLTESNPYTLAGGPSMEVDPTSQEGYKTFWDRQEATKASWQLTTPGPVGTVKTTVNRANGSQCAVLSGENSHRHLIVNTNHIFKALEFTISPDGNLILCTNFRRISVINLKGETLFEQEQAYEGVWDPASNKLAFTYAPDPSDGLLGQAPPSEVKQWDGTNIS